MRPECLAAASAYQWVPGARRVSGRAGERLGHGTGASLEFMDFRSYVPGDDLRSVDWRGYARTDQLHVRLYREEVAPAFDVIVDASLSMGVSPEKEQALHDVCDAVVWWIEQSGGHPRLLRSGAHSFHKDQPFELTEVPSGTLLPHTPLQTNSTRVLLSDFLFPEDPTPQLHRLLQGAADVVVLQLLDLWELSPVLSEVAQLVDCESSQQAHVSWTPAMQNLYKTRLHALQDHLAATVRSQGGRYACVTAKSPADMFGGDLLAQRIVEPA